MCSLEEAWGTDYKSKYGGTGDSQVYFSNSGLHEDYNTTPDNLFNQGQNLPAPAVSKTMRMPANRRLSSVDCKKEGKIPRVPSATIPQPLNNCTMPMYPLKDDNLEANQLPCKQEKFVSTSNNMKVDYPHWNQPTNQALATTETTHNVDTSLALYQQHQELLDMLNAINEKIDRIEQNMNTSPRNLNDMILYIIVGMMISLVVYLIINKLA